MDPHTLNVLEWSAVKDLLLKRCAGPMGRRLAADLEPESDSARVRLALKQTSELRGLLDGGVELPLKELEDPVALLDGAHREKRSLEPREIAAIMRVMRRTRDLRHLVAQHGDDLEEIRCLVDQFLDLTDLLDTMAQVVEPPDAMREDGSERLCSLHRERRGVETEIHDELHRLLQLSEVQAALQNPRPTVRHDRWVLAVKKDLKGRVPGLEVDQSQSGATRFVEPRTIIPLGHRLRDLDMAISREAQRILWELTRTLRGSRNRLLHTANILSWLDLTQAKARLSRDFDMVPAEPSKNGVLRLLQARHPLLLALKDTDVVPLDVRLGEGFRILVVTGPNTGGKTVALKTVGLLQLMHQAGMHIPAAPGSRLPVFSSVHGDIGDEQSITQSLSTFSGHIKNIARILARCGRRSLVLLDELGAGTDPEEGAALGRAILEELRHRKSAAMVTTHLGSLKEYACEHPEVENACVTFDLESMRPTYRLLIGQPGNSNALLIAGRCGLDTNVLQRADEELRQRQDRPEHEMIEKLQASRQELESRRQESEKQLQKSRNLARSAEELQRQLDERARRLMGEAEAVIDRAMRELVAELAPVLRRLNNVPGPLKESVSDLEEILRCRAAETTLAKRRRVLIATLKKQDLVYVPHLGQTCRIRRFHRAEEKLTVMVGNMAVEIAYDDVGLVEHPLLPPDSQKS